ncbi:MAG: ATP-binding cassette domain-containing protein, partial [Microvirga sp.]
MTDALIELANVSKSFTRGGLLSHCRVQAVDDVSFRIAADDPVIFTIIGESGSGKSTLARMILNITPPTSGSIVFRGRDLSTIR